MDDEKRAFLRHTVSTLAYRAAKALRDAPAGFAELKASETSRTPHQILLHMGDLIDWALSIAQGKEAWKEKKAESWQKDTDRFFASLKKLDDYLASGLLLRNEVERIFQGPIADALTHTGQITFLRRLGGASVRGENYSEADIQTGRVGKDQTSPSREFD
ncbi:MAG TPA: hypothetical protein VLR94_04745 [Acidobacteriota bacterium]|nr:hypothetical protein [Acidobacteriota bacterium]